MGPSNASTLYADAAWLATQMFKPASQNTNITESYLAYALWSLFNPNALTGLSPSQQSSAEAWLNSIPQGLTPSQFANFFIYTPDMTKSITCGGGTCPTAPPQEFLGFTVPEGGPVLLYLLLAAISCFGAIVPDIVGRRTLQFASSRSGFTLWSQCRRSSLRVWVEMLASHANNLDRS